MEKTVITSTEYETQKFGEQFAKLLKPGDVACLYGNLGSGKTTFVKGVARGLGITSRVISPTFVVVRKHKTGIKNNELGIKNLYHIDLYRLESEEGVTGIDLKDILDEKDAVTCIEWSERAETYFQNSAWKITFEHIENNTRKVHIHETTK